MNILFLIGNGFDLNLDMKTKYSHFYNYYKSIPSKSDSVKKLKNAISNNIENWSDLELALGAYTDNIESEKAFFEVYDDISDSLADYLQDIENNFDFENIDGKKLYNYFSFPENSLPTADNITISTFRNKWNLAQWNIYAITFNYTSSLEKLMQYNSQKRINIGNHHNTHPIIFQRLEHVHGYYDKRMIMGVNDASQIANKNFLENEKILRELVKDKCNQAQKHMFEVWCKKQITNSNLICVFGSSLGDTDNMWWELIGEQLKRDCFLIIFAKGEVINPRKPQRTVAQEEEIKNYFLNKTKLNIDEKQIAANKIIVGVNTNMFDLI